MASKYDKPEWRTTPVRAQIDEALREVDQIKQVLQSLRSKAPQLDHWYQARKVALTDPGKDRALSNMRLLGDWQGNLAKVELDKLDGWVKSLLESELGLQAMVTGGSAFSGDVMPFYVNRSRWYEAEFKSWQSIRSQYLMFGLNDPARK